MERLSSIAGKTFVDDLRSGPRPADARAPVKNPISLAPPTAKKLAKVAKKDGQRDYTAERTEAASV